LPGSEKADFEFARNESVARDGPRRTGTEVTVVTDKVRTRVLSGRMASDEGEFFCGGVICVVVAYVPVDAPAMAEGDEAGARRGLTS
jgi:hypothetical protein